MSISQESLSLISMRNSAITVPQMHIPSKTQFQIRFLFTVVSWLPVPLVFQVTGPRATTVNMIRTISDSDIMFCLQSYPGLIIDRSLVLVLADQDEFRYSSSTSLLFIINSK